jgi:hypothetical protein
MISPTLYHLMVSLVRAIMVKQVQTITIASLLLLLQMTLIMIQCKLYLSLRQPLTNHHLTTAIVVAHPMARLTAHHLIMEMELRLMLLRLPSLS